MDKLLLTLTLVAFLSGVPCSTGQYFLDTNQQSIQHRDQTKNRPFPPPFNSTVDQEQIVKSSESSSTADSVAPTDNMTCNHYYHAAQQVFHLNVLPDMLRKVMKGCVSNVQRDDYVVTVGVGAHKLHKQHPMSWNEARKICMAEGGQLAILNSEHEAKMLVNWMNNTKIHSAWLGIHDQFSEGDWVTLTGESLYTTGYNTWTTWWAYQPDNQGGNQNCGTLIKHGGLDDGNCQVPLPYFCKINLC